MGFYSEWHVDYDISYTDNRFPRGEKLYNIAMSLSIWLYFLWEYPHEVGDLEHKFPSNVPRVIPDDSI